MRREKSENQVEGKSGASSPVIPAPQAYVKAAAVKTLVVVVSPAGRSVPQKGAGSHAGYNVSVGVNSPTLCKP